MIVHPVVEIADRDASNQSRPRNGSGEQQPEGDAMPQYMLLIYGPAEGPPPSVDLDAQMPRWEAFTQGLAEAGVLIGGEQLDATDTASTVRVRDGETQITDGPFAMTKEFLAGYYLVDVPDLDTALAYAARVPHIDYGSVEVRPIVTRDG
jgi:hypothetical protein